MIFNNKQLCLLALIGLSVTGSWGYPNNRQERRSRGAQVKKNEDYSSDARPPGYYFGEEYFHESEAPPGEEQQASTRSVKENHGCKRVYKDYMVCMVCKDPKTNSKYEQCSYVSSPRGAEETKETQQRKRVNKSPNDKEDKMAAAGQRKVDKMAAQSARKPAYSRFDYYDDGAGEEYENSPSSYRSNDYGNSDEESNRDAKSDEESSRDAESDEESSRDAESEEESSRAAENDEEVEEETRNEPNLCREVQRDGMTCTVCADPENGGNFEKCSYAHQPNDKLYKFSKSRTFGYPHREDEEEE